MRVLGLALVVLIVVGGAAPAAADPLDDAVAALGTASVWLHPQAQRRVDAAAVSAAVGDAPIKIAILPAGPTVAEVRTMPRVLAQQLPGNTVAVIAGRYFYAGSDVLCADEAGRAASRSIEVHEQRLDEEDNSDLTAALIDFVATLKAAPTCGGAGARAEAGSGAAGVLPWIAVTSTVALIAVGGWVLATRRRTRSAAAARRAGAEAAVGALAALLGTTPADRATDARDRLAEAEALLAGANTDDQFETALRVAEQGLLAARGAEEDR